MSHALVSLWTLLLTSHMTLQAWKRSQHPLSMSSCQAPCWAVSHFIFMVTMLGDNWHYFLWGCGGLTNTVNKDSKLRIKTRVVLDPSLLWFRTLFPHLFWGQGRVPACLQTLCEKQMWFWVSMHCIQFRWSQKRIVCPPSRVVIPGEKFSFLAVILGIRW